jgi:hypothetical protein
MTIMPIISPSSPMGARDMSFKAMPDLAQAQEFLTTLDPAADQFTFQVFDESPEGGHEEMATWKHGTLEALSPWLIERNGQRCGVFVMVNRGDGKGRSKKNVTGVRAVFLDLDGAPLSPVSAAIPQPNIVVESSPGRYHAYWLIEDCPLASFGSVQRALAEKYKGDPSVSDSCRVMRLPGFYHQKYQPFLSRMLQTC